MSEIAKPDIKSKSILGFLILGGVLLFELLLRQYQYVEQDKFGKLINISGRQRMLSQRTLLLANQFLKNKNEATKVALKLEIAEFRDNHLFLTGKRTYGDFSVLSSEDIEDIYFFGADSLDIQINRYLKGLETILKDDVSVSDKEEVLSELSSKNYELLVGLNNAVFRIENVGESSLEVIKYIDIGFYLIFIISLLFLFGFVFIPMSNSIGKSFEMLLEHEKKLEDKNKQMRKALKIKEDFLSSLSHEIRTPINAIIGTTLEFDDQENEKVDVIRSSARTLLSLFDDAIEIKLLSSKNIQVNEDNFDLAKELKNVKKMIYGEVEKKGLQLDLILHNDFPKSVSGDKERLNQVLLYLLSNAIKFTSTGNIGIEVKKTENDLFEFSVWDSGIGISEEFFDKIFDEYYQIDSSTTRKYGGMGVGLSLAKKIVMALGGEKISVESKLGEGSKFTFKIPLKQSNETDNNLTENTLDSIKVLVVEDNELNQKLSKIYLKKMNLNCDLAENGLEALNKMKIKKYDLVLMDIQMPIMDGVSATKKIIAEYGDRRPKIIALTANVLKDDQKNYLDIGMDDFIPKPIELKRFKKTILKVLGK